MHWILRYDYCGSHRQRMIRGACILDLFREKAEAAKLKKGPSKGWNS